MLDSGKRGWLRQAAILGVAALSLTACGKKEEAAPAAAPAAAAPAPAAAPEPLKIGFAYVGPVGDAGWTFAHDNARKAIEAE
ncbi:MAG TPA: BMP family ABC transporter substrate-binding protein, partial [Burkholderiaceae bacterium]|nr:BMP family ABC transporter substrate-binding protein [Burkholderiaceae bacterium]